MSNSLARNGKATKVWESKRIVVMVSLVLVIAIALVGMTSIRNSNVKYKNTPVAVPPQLCPGDEFTYRVVVNVKEPDTVIHITEDWCKTSTAICPKEFTTAPVDHNVRYPVLVDTPATRVVPTTMPPGEWTFGHCNTSYRDGELPEVSCYYVPVTVKACEK